ncbi:SRPBCC domain-containing protein [Terracidiphilus gabretensis]|jgi:uncharacterized protein YndB with AHSA1/START domain|uniref:SRPBCC domain-containing protein n=1 Tax=Terracidiphilus gabretensis TaxID=1577687 RepID=UPI00071B1294|nr:SRPBCC domain-containing protein [Terracidiphilus gabretensis]
MAEPKVVHNTFVLERKFEQPAKVVFEAFSDPEKALRWYAADRSNEVTEFAQDFSEGGLQRMVYKMGPQTPFPGTPLENEGRFQEIVPNERVVIASTMKIGGHRISVTQSTFELLPTAEGTELIFTHQGAFLPGSDGPKMREDGWNTLLDRLTAVVTAGEA